MVEVHEATYIPGPDGGEIRAQMKLGRHELTTTLPVADDQGLQPLVEGLMVEVQRVTFAATADGGEIRATLKVGDQAFMSRVSIDGEDQALKARLDQLLNRVGQDLTQDLQAELGAETTTIR